MKYTNFIKFLNLNTKDPSWRIKKKAYHFIQHRICYYMFFRINRGRNVDEAAFIDIMSITGWILCFGVFRRITRTRSHVIQSVNHVNPPHWTFLWYPFITLCLECVAKDNIFSSGIVTFSPRVMYALGTAAPPTSNASQKQ